jgi:hypothetical protein
VEVVMEIDDVASQHLGSGQIFISLLPNFPTRWHGPIGPGDVWCDSPVLGGLGGSGPLYGSLQVGL